MQVPTSARSTGVLAPPRLPQTPAARTGRLFFTGLLALFIPLACVVLVAWFRNRTRRSNR